MRVVFANQLRGVAALMVVVSHYFGSFFFQQKYITTITGATESGLSANDFILSRLLAKHFLFINFGPLGVSLFFLVSGFVIMFSLRKLNTTQFIMQRLFRIFPTYWVSLIVCFIFTLFSSWFFSGTSGYYSLGISKVLSNLFLVYDYLGHESIDFVNWTLPIEILFYFTISLVACRFTSKGNLAAYISVVSITTLVFLLHCLSLGQQWHALMSLLFKIKYLSFMCIGLIFYFHFKSLVSYQFMVLMCFLLCTVFYLLLGLEMGWGEAIPLFANYIYGLAIFSLMYLFRGKMKENKLMDFMANISYPLYLIHSTIGYCLIPILINYSFGFYSAATISLLITVALSFLMHKTIEKKSIFIGKHLTTQPSP